MVDDHTRDALRVAMQVASMGSSNLIAPTESDLSILREVARPARGILDVPNLTYTSEV